MNEEATERTTILNRLMSENADLRERNEALWSRLKLTGQKWESDASLLCGALWLLAERGLAVGSAELIAAAERAKTASNGCPVAQASEQPFDSGGVG